MSRPQGHRKSQSTSALNVLASPSIHLSSLNQSTTTQTPTPATPRSRRAQGSSISRLGSVVEDDSERKERSNPHSRSHVREESKDGLDGLLGMISSRTPRKERIHHEKGKSSDSLGLDDLRAAVGDVSGLFAASCILWPYSPSSYGHFGHQIDDVWLLYGISNGYSLLVVPDNPA